MSIATVMGAVLAGTCMIYAAPKKRKANIAAEENKTAVQVINAIDNVAPDINDAALEQADSLFEAALDAIPLLEPYDYDRLLTMWHEQTRPDTYGAFYREFIDIDTTLYNSSNVPDSVYEARLNMLFSPIGLPYNRIVKNYIIAYTTTKKSTMERVLGRSEFYFPIIEPALDRHDLPQELRMLPVVESALSPTAVSRVGATGLWQFMYGTGKQYGLQVTSFIDQRRDPVASTEAACLFLKDLYKIYGDWTLALAAYNCGPGNVNKAIRRAGGETKSFWDIYPYLPRETRGYVPSFIAATYAYTFYMEHDIEPEESKLPLLTDTLMIDRPLHFKQITSTIDTPIDVIRALNPQYKLDIVPATSGKTYPLRLPAIDIANYIDNETEIHSKDMQYMAEYLKPSNIDPTKNELQLNSYTYRVKSGDTLTGIAAKNGVKVSQLMKWNNISNPNQLRVGQRIEIYR